MFYLVFINPYGQHCCSSVDMFGMPTLRHLLVGIMHAHCAGLSVSVPDEAGWQVEHANLLYVMSYAAEYLKIALIVLDSIYYEQSSS